MKQEVHEWHIGMEDQYGKITLDIFLRRLIHEGYRITHVINSYKKLEEDEVHIKSALIITDK